MGVVLGGGPDWGAPAPLTLAAGAVGSVMLWLGVLLVVVLIGGVALLLIRRWLFDVGSEDGALGWDLRSLRGMRDRGEISEEEYEIARARIIGVLSGDASPASAPGAARRATDSVGVLRARPGYDLTGEPLPDFRDGEDAPPGDHQRPEK